MFWVGGHFGVVDELAGGGGGRGCCGLCGKCVWDWDWLMGGWAVHDCMSGIIILEKMK